MQPDVEIGASRSAPAWPVIKPLMRGVLCATAHPDGCRRALIDQIERVDRAPKFAGPQTALIIGSSMGLGLAGRLALMFGGGSKTFGVCSERPGTSSRTASPGWYNAAALETEALARGQLAPTLVGDAFSAETKQRTVSFLEQHFGGVDLVLYSVASRQRRHPKTGQLHLSSLKAVGQVCSDKALNPASGEVFQSTMPVADDRELADTVAVMGGDDFGLWLEALEQAGLIRSGFRALAFSYVGPERFWPMYRRATIGVAKEHLEMTARSWSEQLARHGGAASVAVMKALVTQSSLALPMGVLYSVLLTRLLGERGLDEGALEQCLRLFGEKLYGIDTPPTDAEQRLRMDDRELDPGLQHELLERWQRVTTRDVQVLGDLATFASQLRQLYGFGVPGVDYERPVATMPDWAAQVGAEQEREP